VTFNSSSEGVLDLLSAITDIHTGAESTSGLIPALVRMRAFFATPIPDAELQLFVDKLPRFDCDMDALKKIQNQAQLKMRAIRKSSQKNATIVSYALIYMFARADADVYRAQIQKLPDSLFRGTVGAEAWSLRALWSFSLGSQSESQAK
jgi:hypothetical protein